MKLKLLVSLILLQLCEISCVCNITALSSVDAITLRKDGLAEKHYDVNFNLMDGYKVIYITRANVTELCEGIVKFFNVLEELNVINANISSIERNAFQHVPKLKKLSLAVNNLHTLKAGHVNEIKTLQVLYLTENKLKDVDKDTFDNMINLKRIYLNRNKLDAINREWFQNCPNLELIDLSHNRIVEIPSNAFQNIRPTSLEHFVQYKLGYNQIERINEEALDTEKEFLILRLDRNRLRELPLAVYTNLKKLNSVVLNSNVIDCLDQAILDDLKKTTVSLHLVNNPISCECLDKFDQFVNENAIQATFYYNSTFNCQLLKQIPVFGD